MSEKIKSKYIFNNIFEYIQRNSDKFKLKLIKHNKTLQKILDIDLIDYQKFYLNQKYIFYNNYPRINFGKNNFDKNILYKQTEDDLKEYNLKIDDVKKIFEKYNKKYFKKEKTNKIYILDNEKDIKIYDIYSPFIDSIIPFKNHIFINLPLNYIKKYNIINDYKNFFKKNENNITLLNISFDEMEQIKLLKELITNSFLIECIYIDFKGKKNSKNFNEDADEEDQNLDKKNNDKNNLLSQLFEFGINQKNLSTLNLNLSDYSFNNINNIFTSLNNLQSLKNIYLQFINLPDKLIIKLEQLEILKLYHCNNIYLDNNISTKSIKYLDINHLNEDINSDENYNYDFPNLEELNIFNSNININYESLIKLKKLGFEKIIILENCIKYSPIEEIKQFGNFNNENDEKKMIYMILNKKSLKIISIELKYITNKNLKEFNKKNENINNINKIKFK